jgi:hypothetical protein
VGNDLDGLAKVVAAALLGDDLFVDAAGGEIVIAGESSVTKTSPCWKGDMVPGSTLR